MVDSSKQTFMRATMACDFWQQPRNRDDGPYLIPRGTQGDVLCVQHRDGQPIAFLVSWDAAYLPPGALGGPVAARRGVTSLASEAYVTISLEPVESAVDATIRALDDSLDDLDDDALDGVIDDPMDAELDLDEEEDEDETPPGWENLLDNPWVVAYEHRDGHRVAGRWQRRLGLWRYAILRRSEPGSDGRWYETAEEAMAACQYDAAVTPHPDRPDTADGELPAGWREDCHGDAFAPDGSIVGYEPTKRDWFVYRPAARPFRGPRYFARRQEAIACLQRHLVAAGEDAS